MFEELEEVRYFADELYEITPRMIPSSFGDIYSITAGAPGQPLMLIVHGSGPKNSSNQYHYLLQEYLVRISYIQKFYIVAIDCPGYGRSQGSKEAVKTFPLKLFKEILAALKYDNYYAMYGHSQGGAAIFNAVYEDPNLTEFMIMDRPVCGNIQRFRGFSLPTLLIYDIEDDGHPIWQGKLLYKELTNTELYTYKNSLHQYWVPDNIWNKMLDFFIKKSKYHFKNRFGQINNYRRNKSEIKKEQFHEQKEKIKPKRMCNSLGKKQEEEKQEQIENKLNEIEEIEKSELFSLSSPEQLDESRSISNEGESIHFQREDMLEFKELKPRSSEKQMLEEKEHLKPLLKREEKEKPFLELKEEGRNQFQEKEQPNKSEQVMKQKDELEVDKCAICYDYYYRPVVTNCHHTFCHKCILEALLVNEKCPLCRTKITKKTENHKLHAEILLMIAPEIKIKRENEYRKLQQMLESIVYIEIGNNSTELQTKQSIFTKTKKKFNWQIYVKSPKNFALDEVGFNINMGDTYSKPIIVKNQPFTFESRGTFSFSCEITIKPRNKEYADLVSVYRIEVQPGNHHKKVALKKKCYMK